MTTATKGDVLVVARSLITNPDLWTTGTYLNDATGQCCASGALMLACGLDPADASPTDTAGAWDALREVMDGVMVCVFNDERTHAEVLAAFDRAIALAEEASA